MWLRDAEASSEERDVCVCVCVPGVSPWDVGGCERKGERGWKAKESGTSAGNNGLQNAPGRFVHICIPRSTCAWRRVKYKLPFPFFLPLYPSLYPSACAHHVPRSRRAAFRPYFAQVRGSYPCSRNTLCSLQESPESQIREAVSHIKFCILICTVAFDLCRKGSQ